MWIKELLDYIFRLVQLWVTILPWEEGIRIRFGKNQTLLKSGMHLKFPIVDFVYKQQTRLRVNAMPVQTLTTKDGKTITLIISVGYSIINIYKLYNTLSQPESTISNITMSLAVGYIRDKNENELSQMQIEDYINNELNKLNYGLKFDYTKILGFAIVKTYRLIQDHHWTSDSLTIDKHE